MLILYLIGIILVISFLYCRKKDKQQEQRDINRSTHRYSSLETTVKCKKCGFAYVKIGLPMDTLGYMGKCTHCGNYLYNYL